MTSTCPSLLDLGSPDPDARAHVEHCHRCQALQHGITAPQPTEGAATPKPDDDHAVQRGAVWTASAPRADTFLFIVVLDVDEGDVWVAPAADDIDAMHTDFLLPGEQLGFALWVRCAYTFKVLREQLHDEIGRLSEEQTDTVLASVQTLLDGGPFTGNERFGASVIADHDPRLDAAEAFKQNTFPWREPWQLLSTADELGAVCAARRQQLGVSVSELAEDIDVDTEDWTRFEAAQLDLPVSLPTARLAAAVRRLSLPKGPKLLMLAAATVMRTHRPDGGGATLALARRRQGVRRTTARPDPEELRRAADLYSAALGRALGL